MNLVRILAIFVLVVLSVTQRNDERNMQVFTMSSNFQFRNITGNNVTEDMLKSFISFANTASFYYGQDVQKNAKYIKYRMDQVYGSQNDNFYIYIQTQDAQTNWRIWVLVQRIYAGLSEINKINPKWSYYFQKNIGGNKIKDYTYISKDKAGDETYKDGLYIYMKSTINLYQVDNECTCSGQSIEKISNALQNRTQNAWSVICDSKGITRALLQNYGKRWANIKAKSCYYLMYTF